MSVVSRGDVRLAAQIIGANITDEQERAVVAAQLAKLFRARFPAFGTPGFLSLVERAAWNPQDYPELTRLPEEAP
jgi:hypothetical protein